MFKKILSLFLLLLLLSSLLLFFVASSKKEPPPQRTGPRVADQLWPDNHVMKSYQEYCMFIPGYDLPYYFVRYERFDVLGDFVSFNLSHLSYTLTDETQATFAFSMTSSETIEESFDYSSLDQCELYDDGIWHVEFLSGDPILLINSIKYTYKKVSDGPDRLIKIQWTCHNCLFTLSGMSKYPIDRVDTFLGRLTMSFEDAEHMIKSLNGAMFGLPLES